jgi:dienelactone hydrolase
MRSQLVRLGLIVACTALAAGQIAVGQERVSVPALDGDTSLTAYLLRPAAAGAHPALVLLHGCSGLTAGGRMFPLYRSWARLLANAGYVTLAVDSAGSRGLGQTCTAGPARRRVFAERPKDAYAALRYLQSQSFVRTDRIGVIGWSQGGATVLLAIAAQSRARPAGLKHDFAAAVAFYPGRCSDRFQSRPFVDAGPGSWTTAIPLLVLFGEADNWTQATPCAELIAAAKARGAPAEIKLYPGAHHVFDAPNLPQRELPEYRLESGVVPIVATDPAARADALVRVQEFLRRQLGQ